MQVIPWKGEQQIDAGHVGSTLRSEGYGITAHPILKHLPDRPMVSEYEETLWLVNGKIEFNLGNQMLTLNSGDRIFIPKGSQYRFKAVSDSAYYLFGKKV